MTGKLHYLTQGDLAGLFIEELGWDHPRGRTDRTVTIDGVAYPAKPVAEKAGVVVLRVPDPLDAAARDQVKRELRHHFAESLAVFVDSSDRVTFEWTEDRASGTKRRVTHTFVPGRANTALLERLAAISFDGDRPNPTVVEVRGKLAQTFTVDRVTRDFYRKYDTHHKKVTAAIQGIPGEEERRWYTSILLNRLMFVYFLQKRGFLDGNVNYLRNRFDTVRATHGEGQYQTFFRAFLRHLFLTGLGEKPERRDREFTKLIGDVPYVNGGLFSQHEIEARHEGIDIPDTVFDDLFTFLDSYQWHLDDRPLADERTINPDVLGYIFEQYINQKEQGAYYTKEDVTGYMCRHTILPWVLDRAAALAKDQSIEFNPWPLLTKNPYRYLPESLLHGTQNPLPSDVDLDGEQGFQRAPDDEDPVRLPAESWLECWARRNQATVAINTLAEGKVVDSNAAVTLNVDLQRVLSDYVASCEDEATLLLLWDAVISCTTLDPTCGSGAFLFAALQVLEDAAEAVFSRLDALVADDDRANHRVLGPAAAYLSHRYWLRKHIILQTLYGVDLMAEATEVAKLRLFLALMSHVQSREDLEPLPDLDFNIRAGNAVVGYVSPEEAIKDLDSLSFSLFGAPAGTPTGKQVETAMGRVTDAYVAFVEGQYLNVSRDHHLRLKAKLKETGDEFRHLLDASLAGKRCPVAKKRQAWVEAVRPLHWIAEFPQILIPGGFAVVAGNPPYLPLGKLDRALGRRPLEVKTKGGKKEPLYYLEGFSTAACPDLYAMVCERASQLTANHGRIAMIVPHNVAFSERFSSLRQFWEARFPSLWVSTYSRIPDQLFTGAAVRNAVVLGAPGDPQLNVTKMHRWATAYRPHLLACLSYVQPGPLLRSATGWPKVGNSIVAGFFEQQLGRRLPDPDYFAPPPPQAPGTLFVDETDTSTTPQLRWKSTGLNVLSFFEVDPPCTKDGVPVPHTAVKNMVVRDRTSLESLVVGLNGRLFFAWWLVSGDGFNVTAGTVQSFPVDYSILGDTQSVSAAYIALWDRMQASGMTTLKCGRAVGNYDLRLCRDLTDQSDQALVGDPAVWRALRAMVASGVFSGGEEDADDESTADENVAVAG